MGKEKNALRMCSANETKRNETNLVPMNFLKRNCFAYSKFSSDIWENRYDQQWWSRVFPSIWTEEEITIHRGQI